MVDGRILLDQSVRGHFFKPDVERNVVTNWASKKEAEVLSLVAQALFLERKTVERHINSIYTKLDGQSSDGHPRMNTILAYLRASGRLDAA